MEGEWGTQSHAQVKKLLSYCYRYRGGGDMKISRGCQCYVLVNVNQPSWSQVEDYDAEDDAEGEGRAVLLRWPLDLKSKLRGW